MPEQISNDMERQAAGMSRLIKTAKTLKAAGGLAGASTVGIAGIIKAKLAVVLWISVPLLIIVVIAAAIPMLLLGGTEGESTVLTQYENIRQIVETIVENEANKAQNLINFQFDRAVAMTKEDEDNYRLTSSELEELMSISRSYCSSNIIDAKVSDAAIIRLIAAYQFEVEKELEAMRLDKESSGVSVQEYINAQNTLFVQLTRDLGKFQQALLRGTAASPLFPVTIEFERKEGIVLAKEYERELSYDYIAQFSGYETNADGEQVFDEEGRPIPKYEYIRVRTSYDIAKTKEVLQIRDYTWDVLEIEEGTWEYFDIFNGWVYVVPSEGTAVYALCQIPGVDDAINDVFIEGMFLGLDLEEKLAQYQDRTVKDIIDNMCEALSQSIFGVSYAELVAAASYTVGNAITIEYSQIQEMRSVWKSNGYDNLSGLRQQLIFTGMAIAEKVPYFWGGKSDVLGWDERWNTPQLVSAAGSKSTGSIRPYGLDCTGFVSWAFYNVGVSSIYEDGWDLWGSCDELNRSDLLPGDLGFYWTYNDEGVWDWDHVLIFAGYDPDNGNMLWLHCGAAEGMVALDSPGYANPQSAYYDPKAMTYGRLRSVDYNKELVLPGGAPRFEAPEMSNMYYYSSMNVFNPEYAMPNCTAYAYGRIMERLNVSDPMLCTGNAGRWYSYNVEHRIWQYGQIPKVGAIAVWDRYDHDKGHVAVVEAIANDGLITTSNSAWQGANFYLELFYDPGTCMGSSYRFLGYIYPGDPQ